MQFHQFAPPKQLQTHVRFLWALDAPGTGPNLLRTIADGCPGLVFQQAAPGSIRDETNKPWPTLLLYGQATKPSTVHAPGPFRMVGACFHPSAVPALFDVRADELTDTCLDADLLPTTHRSLCQQLLGSSSPTAQTNLLAAHLLARLRTAHHPPDAGVQQALACILGSQGTVSLPQLRQQMQLSERSLQRRFKYHVGVSPKLFSRICRFQASLAQLRAAHYEKLSDLAFEHDYADQSHYIRTFREFTGISPQQYRRQTRDALENFSELA
ncbi:helix-turn-helix domain-containing protein [Hymenobacter canadensis]|uniref:Helix-turn-helix domain-containing protein n=1 Tax=Hymenobacter canadensis TaxID=2999067 RepID=A0ABY7LT59_9BACT|nr:helix-turn-helix domain-containing protein [Hymenobacter canadensis]WBA43592.1 helix-turn-helix domain-containing protein [Hymenobacter canadensis]